MESRWQQRSNSARLGCVSLRFLLVRATLLPATRRFTGHPQLHQRPNADLLVRGPAKLAAVGHADMTAMPDAAPTLMALAPFLPAPTRITGLATLRVKECDRLAAGATELRKAGATVHTEPAAMTIAPAPKLRPAAFDTYEDHRMAMALSVLASGIGGCEIRDPGCVAKTYADYWRDFEQVCRGA